MKLLFVLTVPVAIIAALATESRDRDFRNLLGQQPLLFGRRGHNPKMNSLFYGRKRFVDSSVSVEDLVNVCSLLSSYLDKGSDSRDREAVSPTSLLKICQELLPRSWQVRREPSRGYSKGQNSSGSDSESLEPMNLLASN